MDIRGFEVVSAFEEQDINLPTRKTTESAGYDIECAEAVTLEPGQVVLVPTGIKAFMAYDEYLAIHIRSSMAIKRHLALVNSTGIIDSDYYNNEENEGHIMIALLNYGKETVSLEKANAWPKVFSLNTLSLTMTMLQAFVQVVSVALGLCKLNTILNRMVKAAQLKLGGFFIKSFIINIDTHGCVYYNYIIR